MGPWPCRFGRNAERIDFELVLCITEGSNVKDGGWAESVVSVARACL
jgi:hypothetical protein